MTLQQQLSDACDETSGEVDFRNSYSGRGMYGAACVGIVGSMQDCMSVIGQVIKNAAFGNEGLDEVVDTLLQFKTDRMGRDVVLYWEQLEALPFPEEAATDDDGQPDEMQEWHDFDPDC